MSDEIAIGLFCCDGYTGQRLWAAADYKALASKLIQHLPVSELRNVAIRNLLAARNSTLVALSVPCCSS